MNAGSRTTGGRRGRTFRAFLAPALMSGWLLAPEPSRAQEHGSVIGVVVDEENLEPVEGALVALHDFSRRARTDEGGRFELTEVPAGDVVIRIEEDAFISLVETLDITPLEATLVQFRLHRIGAMLDQIVGTTDRPSRGNRRGHSESEISGADAGDQGYPDRRRPASAQHARPQRQPRGRHVGSRAQGASPRRQVHLYDRTSPRSTSTESESMRAARDRPFGRWIRSRLHQSGASASCADRPRRPAIPIPPRA